MLSWSMGAGPFRNMDVTCVMGLSGNSVIHAWYRAIVFDRLLSTDRTSSAGSSRGTSSSTSGEIASTCVVTLSSGEHRHCNMMSWFKLYLVNNCSLTPRLLEQINRSSFSGDTVLSVPRSETLPCQTTLAAPNCGNQF